MTVLRNLPNLEKLDNVPVHPEEVGVKTFVILKTTTHGAPALCAAPRFPYKIGNCQPPTDTIQVAPKFFSNLNKLVLLIINVYLIRMNYFHN